MATETIFFDGMYYSFDSDISLDALQEFENEHYIGAFRKILGEEQWEQFNSKKRTADDMMELSTMIGVAINSSHYSSTEKKKGRVSQYLYAWMLVIFFFYGVVSFGFDIVSRLK